MHIEELSLVAVAALVLVVGISMLSGRIGVAAPLVLVVVGIGIGYLPGVPLIELDPEIILLGVLPPLLYAAAVNVPILDLKRNVGPITALSVGLVIISALVIGGLLHLAVPAIPFAAASNALQPSLFMALKSVSNSRSALPICSPSPSSRSNSSPFVHLKYRANSAAVSISGLVFPSS